MAKLWTYCLPSLLVVFVYCVFYSTIPTSTPTVPVRTVTTRIHAVTSAASAAPFKMVEMNDRVPSYKLMTIDGHKPYADGDRAQATVVNHLQLVETCKRDPSLIVVDIGAYLGDFGLYAAACGCQVFLFEVQLEMVSLIHTSIELNNFSSQHIRVIQKAVSDLPSNSQLQFATRGGETTATGGNLNVSTIRLDDVEWPRDSTIYLLKVDVEGFELNVLRSALKLFAEKRVRHLIFEYTAWWTHRAAQQDLLPFVENTLKPNRLYALHRTAKNVYGPLDRKDLDAFHENHVKRHLQTDIYATFDESTSSISAEPYYPGSSFA